MASERVTRTPLDDAWRRFFTRSISRATSSGKRMTNWTLLGIHLPFLVAKALTMLLTSFFLPSGFEELSFSDFVSNA